MQVSAISPALLGASTVEPGLPSGKTQNLGEASRGFEAILLRQFLGESMKGLLQGGQTGEVYGYLLTDALADSLSKAGGMGLSSVIQLQLEGGKP